MSAEGCDRCGAEAEELTSLDAEGLRLCDDCRAAEERQAVEAELDCRGGFFLNEPELMTSCSYHCRRCGSHFTSLEAFDAHHEGSGESLRPCVFADGHGLVERTGFCRIGDPETPAVAVTLYESGRAARYREYRQAPGSRQTAEAERKSQAAA